MKKIILGCFIVFASSLVWGQNKAEEIEPFALESKSHDYYVQQYELWNKEISKDKKNEGAWLNLYAAARYAKNACKDESIREKWNKRQLEVVERVEKNIPNTFAFYHIMSYQKPVWTGKNDADRKTLMQYALKAHELQPNNPDVYPDLMNIYQIYTPDKEKLKEISTKWKNSSYHSSFMMAMAYNMLLTANEGAIVLTGGDNDTYPLWIAQNADGVRDDVTVLNIYLASIENYRNRIFNALNIPELAGEQPADKIISHILKHSKDRSIYFSSKGVIGNNEELGKSLYNTGILYLYSTEEVDNISILVNNFENRMLLDQVYHSFYCSPYHLHDMRSASLYVPGLYLLFKHYKIIEKPIEAERTKKAMLRIAEKFEYFDYLKRELGLE